MRQIANNIKNNRCKGTNADLRALVGWLRNEGGIRENRIIPAHICEEIKCERVVCIRVHIVSSIKVSHAKYKHSESPKLAAYVAMRLGESLHAP